MKTTLTLLLFPLLATVSQAQGTAAAPVAGITVPSTSQVATNFKSPPHEYGAISPFTGWDGPDPACSSSDYI